MCGIAGLYGITNKVEEKEAITVLSNQLAHRGPDGKGHFTDDKLSLVHTRLSIIDLSECANQPLYNEDKTLVLICNGEIYNYKSLTQDLVKKNHVFSSNSDSEVILHLYEECNGNLDYVLQQLTGMFAFAIWDIKKQALYIARDRIGIKPLYYSYKEGALIFASEVKPIAATGLIDNEIDVTSLYEFFLLGAIPGPNTIYEYVKSLEPGHYIKIEDGVFSVTEYWDVPTGIRQWASEQDLVKETERLLTEIIQDHLVADVPVGTFLSAGIDSSLITAIAAHLHPGIHSFTASFPGEPEDEGSTAAATGVKLNTTHHSYEMKENFFKDFTTQFKDIDQPFAISSALSLGRISGVAKEYVKVVLSGDGADELFGGYNRYESAKHPYFLNYIPKAFQNTLLKWGAFITQKNSLSLLRKNLSIPEEQVYLDRIIVNDPDEVLHLFIPAVAEKIDKDRFKRRLKKYFYKRQGEDNLNRILYVDLKTTLADEMLTKCDRMTMINGVEGRVPFLDHRMVEFAFKVPGKYKRVNGTGKVVLRKILAKKLGSDLACRVKTGFNSPLQQWLTHDNMTREYAKSSISNLKTKNIFNTTSLDKIIDDVADCNSSLIFALVCLNNY